MIEAGRSTSSDITGCEFSAAQALLVVAKGEGNSSIREWGGQKNAEDSGAQSDTKRRGSQGFVAWGPLLPGSGKEQLYPLTSSSELDLQNSQPINSIPICSQSSRRILPMSLRSVPKIAFCRDFGTMMMWYRQYHRTWLWLCHSRIVVSPSCGLGESTPGETTSLFTNQRWNGRAFSSLSARGGGLPCSS